MVKAMFTLCLNPATSSFAEMTDRQGGNLKLPSINTFLVASRSTPLSFFAAEQMPSRPCKQ